MRKVGLILVALLLVASTAMAWDFHGQGKALVDSNELVIIDVDSADLSDWTLHIDTTYLPNASGYNFGWPKHIQLQYGVSAIDGTPFPEGASESDSGHSFLFAVGVDSAHIGIGIETSRDAEYWSTIWIDSTLRATASMRSTASPMLDLSAMMIADTLVGNRFRAVIYLYRDVDSTETDLYNITDSIRLDKCDLKGFNY
jgi:hypothetical protein